MKPPRIKPRVDQVYGTVNVGEDRTLTVHYHPQTDEIEIPGAEEGSTRTERIYQRDSGKPKIVTSVPSEGKAAFSAKQALMAYDWVIAVDTNTRSLFGKRCGVCVAYFTPTPVAASGPQDIPFICLAAYLVVGIRQEVNPETIGWDLILSKHLASSRTPSQRIALVVDSELGIHREINDRKSAYYMNKMLPERVTMVYSSCDNDSETLGGAMIRMCDDMASKIFEKLKTMSLPDQVKQSEDHNYEALYQLPVTRGQNGLKSAP